MGELKHFSHEQHPLTLLEAKKDEIVQKSICFGCEKPISSKPTYSCGECKIFLHKNCAELPREIKHPMHMDHPLILLAKPPYKSGSCRCQACRLPWSNFTYNCSSCEFDIDISCAFTDRKFEHPSHKHPLILVQRPALFECNACDEKGEDESYLCTTCPFWIHKSCGLLPRINERKEHDHPLSLAYCLPIEYRGYGFSCEVCLHKLQPGSWVYFCGPCRYFVHIKCITAKTRRTDVGGYGFPYNYKPKYVQLPNSNLVEVIQYYAGVVKKHDGQPFQEFPEIKIESHKHSLVLSDVRKDSKTTSQEIICDGCIEPIASSYYKCGQCNFCVHVPCAQLPIHFPDPGHYAGPEHTFKLFFSQNSWEFVQCNICNSNCSGYSYKCEACPFLFDVKCGCLRGTIEHKAHRHPIQQKNWIKTGICNACGVKCFYPFSCSACGFYLGLECAMLPQTVKHRWDKHELILSCPPFTDVADQFYCEVCEEEIHPKRWAYRCTECDQSFHPKCIPTLGTSRNIKFGRTIEISDHLHPLTIVPECKFQLCNSCDKSLHRQKAFECAPCQFHLCLECIKVVD